VKLRMLLRRVSTEFRMLFERDPGDDNMLRRPDDLGCNCGDRYSEGKSAMKSVASRRSASETIRIVEPLASLLLARYALAGGCKKESSSEESESESSVEVSRSTEASAVRASFSFDHSDGTAESRGSHFSSYLPAIDRESRFVTFNVFRSLYLGA
jgi:hypothetical protein